MNPVHILIAIPVLGLINLLSYYYAQYLYHQKYSEHIIFEPKRSMKNLLPLLVGRWIGLTLLFFASPAFLYFQGYTQSAGFSMLGGYLIGYLAFLASQSVVSIIIFRYAKNNPATISGQTIIKAPFSRIIISTGMLQALILIGVILFFAPSDFLIGTFASLLLGTVISLFAKKDPVGL